MSDTNDSRHEIKYDWKNKPGISNLIEIYSELENKKIEVIEKEFAGKSYKEFKEKVADIVVSFLKDFQQKYSSVIETDLKAILEKGSEKAYKLSHSKLSQVYKKVGFIE